MTHTMTATPSANGTKSNIIIIASPRARNKPDSPLLRFVRDYANVLRGFTIHATQETGRSVFSTGIYQKDEIILHRGGADGGIAELAAIVAKRDCKAVILFLEPGDPWSDAVENRALKRVCIQQRIRLTTTYPAAVRWVTYEAAAYLPPSSETDSQYDWRPVNWMEGVVNIKDQGVPLDLTIEDRSLALISHDQMKIEMLKFVNKRIDILKMHHRTITTGTTGWLLKLAFADHSNEPKLINSIRILGKYPRISKVVADILTELGESPSPYEGLDGLLQRLRNQLNIQPCQKFCEKIMPLPSGPEGGDIIIAEEVLRNRCHSIVFFHDPQSSHPHSDDIRLLEHTCQLNSVFAECVSDMHSANIWAAGLEKEVVSIGSPNLAQRLRSEAGLSEVILIDSDDDEDSESLGQALARCCAAYINHCITEISEDGRPARIGVSWGWGARQVLEELHWLRSESLIEVPLRLSSNVVWSPVIGVMAARLTKSEAGLIADAFARFYGGRVEGFSCGAVQLDESMLPEEVGDLIDRLQDSDIVITAGSPWGSDAAIFSATGLKPEHLPDTNDTKVAGVISTLILDTKGVEVHRKYSLVGLDLPGFQKVAQSGKVIVICGGMRRRALALAAIRAKVVSVLVTTRRTAEWLAEQLLPSGRTRVDQPLD
ncbi:MAG: sugar-binding domain-containing protein [Dehalococcoidia bacterium]